MTKAHRVRTVMQMHYLLKKKALTLDEKGLIHIDYKKFVPTAKAMLSDIIKVQLSKDANTAKAFIEENFIWDEAQQKVAANLQRVHKVVNGYVVDKLAKKLLKAV